MDLKQMFPAQLEREVAAARRTLECVPEGRNDWKPHEKSMTLGYVAGEWLRGPILSMIAPRK